MVLIAAALGLQYRSALDQIAAIEWELLAAAQAQKRNIFQMLQAPVACERIQLHHKNGSVASQCHIVELSFCEVLDRNKVVTIILFLELRHEKTYIQDTFASLLSVSHLRFQYNFSAILLDKI